MNNESEGAISFTPYASSSRRGKDVRRLRASDIRRLRVIKATCMREPIDLAKELENADSMQSPKTIHIETETTETTANREEIAFKNLLFIVESTPKGRM